MESAESCAAAPVAVERFFQTARSVLARRRARLEAQIGRHLAELQAELAAAREETRQHDRLHATRFNVFNSFRPNENRLSDVVADLLDPAGMHGQGDAFLRLLGDALGVVLPDVAGVLTVTREDPTTYLANAQRRIDITVDFGNFGLAVENKPWAGEQADQIRDYLEHLHRRYGDGFVLVYLSGDGSPPPSVPVRELAQLEQRGQFRLLAYRTGLADWLDACASRCHAEPVLWLLRHFGKYVRAKFGLAVEDWRGTSHERRE